MRALFLTAVAVLLSLTVAKAAPADEFHQSRAQVVLTNAIDTGSPLYNNGEYENCYLFYRGALRSTLPLLRDRPDLRDQIEAALWRAERTASRGHRAWILRHAIDRTLAGLN